MRPFSELSPRGQRGRLRSFAAGALERYEPHVDPTRCRFVAQSFNTVFRVTAADLRCYALRVGAAERIHAEGTELAEVGWMTALAEGGVCPISRVAAAGDGSLVVRHGHTGVPGERVCVLFDWIPGPTVGDKIDADLVRRIGRLSAVLHEHAGAGIPAPPPPVLVADHVLYWLLEDRLSELTPSYGSVILDARERVQETVDTLWHRPPHAPHLIHGDLSPSNVVVSDARLIPIDFQDLAWGFEVQDVAISLSPLRRYADPEVLVEAFSKGYDDVRRGHQFDPVVLSTLIAGRRLHQLNLGLNLRRFGLAPFIDDAVAFLRDWMDSSDSRR